MTKLPPKLWRVIKKDGSHLTADSEAFMSSAVGSDQEVRIGVYRLVETYVAVKTVRFERKAGRKRRQ